MSGIIAPRATSPAFASLPGPPDRPERCGREQWREAGSVQDLRCAHGRFSRLVWRAASHHCQRRFGECAAGKIPGTKLANAGVTAAQIANNTITGTKIAGRTITASNIAAGTITTNEIAAASLTTSQFTAQTLQDILIPPGSINAFMGTNPPPGWLLCDGTVVGRTTYARLFAVIGTSSGPGDGSTTFHLPDLRGMFLRGVNGSRNGTDFLDPDAALRTNVITGANSGNTIGSVQFDDLKSHSHNLSQNITQPAGGPIGGSGP